MTAVGLNQGVFSWLLNDKFIKKRRICEYETTGKWFCRNHVGCSCLRPKASLDSNCPGTSESAAISGAGQGNYRRRRSCEAASAGRSILCDMSQREAEDG